MAKRTEPVRSTKARRRPPEGVAARRSGETGRRTSEAPPGRAGGAPPRRQKATREQRPERSAPRTSPMPKRSSRPTDAPARPKNAAQAKARAKARKAKAPKVVRPPLRERLLIKLSSVDFDPRRYVTRVPFVVLVIGALGLGLGVTLWLSTDAAERSYQLGHAQETNQALLQQKEALERDVLVAQAAPALAESARDLGMIPSRDTAHLVQDPSGNWVVVGTPKPAEGVSPPPLNSPLPEPTPPGPPPPPAPRVVEPREVAVHLPPRPAVAPNPEVPVPAGTVPTAPVAPAPAVPADGSVTPLADTTHTEAPPNTRPLPGPPAGADPVAPLEVPAPGGPV